MPKDTTREMDSLQNELWMKRTPQERSRCAAEMFAMARGIVLASLPDSLSEHELQDEVFFRTYGYHLPADFFEQAN